MRLLLQWNYRKMMPLGNDLNVKVQGEIVSEIPLGGIADLC
jgi:hypothetical protein